MLFSDLRVRFAHPRKGNRRCAISNSSMLQMAGFCVWRIPFSYRCYCSYAFYWGWQLWQAGHGKLSDVAKVVDYFTSLGIPAPSLNAHFIALLETIGGILLILGLGSRITSLLLAADMTVALIVADREALGSIFSDPDKFYAAAPYTFLFASLLVLIFGPGWLSLDTLIARYQKSGRA